jgi:hypothetical protein
MNYNSQTNAYEIPRNTISIEEQGQIRIHFEDAFFAEAELIFYDYAQQSLHAHFGDSSRCIGSVPSDIAEHMHANARLCLTAPHSEGHMVVLDTKLYALN